MLLKLHLVKKKPKKLKKFVPNIFDGNDEDENFSSTTQNTTVSKFGADLENFKNSNFFNKSPQHIKQRKSIVGVSHLHLSSMKTNEPISPQKLFNYERLESFENSPMKKEESTPQKEISSPLKEVEEIDEESAFTCYKIKKGTSLKKT